MFSNEEKVFQEQSDELGKKLETLETLFESLKHEKNELWRKNREDMRSLILTLNKVNTGLQREYRNISSDPTALRVAKNTNKTSKEQICSFENNHMLLNTDSLIYLLTERKFDELNNVVADVKEYYESLDYFLNSTFITQNIYNQAVSNPEFYLQKLEDSRLHVQKTIRGVELNDELRSKHHRVANRPLAIQQEGQSSSALVPSANSPS